MTNLYYQRVQSTDSIAEAWGVNPNTLRRWMNGSRTTKGDNQARWEDINLCFEYDPIHKEWIPKERRNRG